MSMKTTARALSLLLLAALLTGCVNLSGYQVVWNSGVVGDDGGTLTVYCPDGQLATGGGGEVTAAGLSLTASKPLGEHLDAGFGQKQTATGWQIAVAGSPSTAARSPLPTNPVSVYVFCIDPR
jgi:hypothetical protein